MGEKPAYQHIPYVTSDPPIDNTSDPPIDDSEYRTEIENIICHIHFSFLFQTECSPVNNHILEIQFEEKLDYKHVLPSIMSARKSDGFAENRTA